MLKDFAAFAVGLSGEGKRGAPSLQEERLKAPAVLLNRVSAQILTVETEQIECNHARPTCAFSGAQRVEVVAALRIEDLTVGERTRHNMSRM